MLAQTLLVQVARSLDFVVSVGALSVLIELEWALAAAWHFSAHESCCVLLELGALGLNLKFVVAEEASGILAEHTRLHVNIRGLLSTLASFNLESRLRLVFSVESSLVGLEN